ncbi:MAG TPA: aldo/keto reductase [Casimicrobiaceae bacterium]|nr:aldo/keto reductase [Casimicrobiaceae bacterium]
MTVRRDGRPFLPASGSGTFRSRDIPVVEYSFAAHASREAPGSALDLRAEVERFSPHNLAANRSVVDLLQRFADENSSTPSQVALAWLLAQKPWIVPIPGTRNIDHLNENLEAINVRLTQANRREIDAAFSKIKVHSGRMSEKFMRDVDPSV